jgi:hypothetical protein
MADENIFPDEFVPNIEGQQYHSRWVRSNPDENAKWEAFSNDIIAGKVSTPPTMATKYGKALVAAGKLHMSVTDIGSAPPPVVLPPPTGTLYDQLSDFQVQPWGGTYIINAYQRTYPANGYQLLGSGSPWPRIGTPAVVEVSTPQGLGFYFRVWPEMVHGDPSGDAKSCLVPDDNHILLNNNTQNAPFVGRTMDVSFKFMLPAAGNPSFAPFPGWNCLYEYHPGGSYPVNNQLGVDVSNATGYGPCVYVRAHDGNNSDAATPLANYGRRPLQLDHWYDYRRKDTWSRTNGRSEAWIDGAKILDQSGVGNVQANAHGTEYATVQPNFGYYSGNAAAYPRNEVYYADMRITVT